MGKKEKGGKVAIENQLKHLQSLVSIFQDLRLIQGICRSENIEDLKLLLKNTNKRLRL